MKRAVAIALVLVLAVAATLAAHDLFIKPASYFLAPNSASHAYVVNGTFTRSENSSTLDRVRDVSVVGPAGRTHPDAAAWSDRRAQQGGGTPNVGWVAHRRGGIMRVPLRSPGQWYVKFIPMVKVTGDTAVDYESKWASLTFEVR